jgi:hypothetical protein
MKMPSLPWVQSLPVNGCRSNRFLWYRGGSRARFVGGDVEAVAEMIFAMVLRQAVEFHAGVGGAEKSLSS